ncbi:PLDc_N domain-containing protein [Bacillus sp. FJAT-49711]|uniref:PLDc N-terminal domain-containing protein n=1 Tax=Bacillus sp. FJAT-49711 TaxID=2833585 RepID=UPI001BC95EA0|nr:PLD nuclease N-terminal domain-containing protein [Bacillus sp. FJAT-49711]MBS4218587.1 PLDc_N domain-containing protein [Bacillus sp. FJAT-49711]
MSIPWELIAPLIILQLILMAFAITSCIKEETNGPKWLWIVIIVGLNIVGPVLYFIIGKKKY